MSKGPNPPRRKQLHWWRHKPGFGRKYVTMHVSNSYLPRMILSGEWFVVSPADANGMVRVGTRV